MKLFDSHAHLTSSQIVEQAGEFVNQALSVGVQQIVNICTDQASLEAGLNLAQQQPIVHNAGATTPHDVAKEGEELFPLFTTHAQAGDFVAIGETGLDYFYEHSPKDLQKQFLIRYLHLALECQLPIIIHCRDAFADFFEILDVEYVTDGHHAPGVLHCFTGTLEEALQVIERGWYLSLSGIVTFKRSEDLREVARKIPLNQLLIETDSPYLAPVPHRGKTNQPAFVTEVANLIATEKGLSPEAVATATYENACRLFRV